MFQQFRIILLLQLRFPFQVYWSLYPIFSHNKWINVWLGDVLGNGWLCLLPFLIWWILYYSYFSLMRWMWRLWIVYVKKENLLIFDCVCEKKNAEKVDRTPDLMIFSHTLSQLSYLGFYFFLPFLYLTMVCSGNSVSPYIVIHKTCKLFEDSHLLLSSTLAVCTILQDTLVVALLRGSWIVVEFTFKPAEGDEVEVECDENENMLEIAQSNDVEVKSCHHLIPVIL